MNDREALAPRVRKANSRKETADGKRRPAGRVIALQRTKPKSIYCAAAHTYSIVRMDP